MLRMFANCMSMLLSQLCTPNKNALQPANLCSEVICTALHVHCSLHSTQPKCEMMRLLQVILSLHDIFCACSPLCMFIPAGERLKHLVLSIHCVPSYCLLTPLVSPEHMKCKLID